MLQVWALTLTNFNESDKILHCASLELSTRSAELGTYSRLIKENPVIEDICPLLGKSTVLTYCCGSKKQGFVYLIVKGCFIR